MIEKPNIKIAIIGNFLAGEESVRSDSVVEGYDDNIHLRRENQARAIEIRVCVLIEASTLDKDIHRQAGTGRGIRRSVDVCKETILRSSVGKIGYAGLKTYETVLAVSVMFSDISTASRYLVCHLNGVIRDRVCRRPEA